ncbi:MAG: hypothetical protein IJ689_04485 [Alphaproteobacteria bacterium]|nr:hypothetical protein [Alphaproteobacteria bacterium]
MNKYILMLGVAAVSIGSYCAYAGNSATMTVTATIAHDVSLNVTQDVELGTITINPAYNGRDTDWSYSDSGIVDYYTQGAIVSADDATVGTFTANIPNPSGCSLIYYGESCNGLSFTDGVVDFGGTGNECGFFIKHVSGNAFSVVPWGCELQNPAATTVGEHSGTIEISYSAS